ncbi:hypothetical protein RKE29_14150 [Streptomyces sp. B1866]|uniref:hypothetical protein n=1 Tax=Streptomyces sp. B1866 TaxID=3075431 RepID=UPI00288FDF0F|nr:hypothetical protein [Streptomyces sp. B1866]MDT3397771.1 hypothetical protein [Streptomyces sp. B1866]
MSADTAVPVPTPELPPVPPGALGRTGRRLAASLRLAAPALGLYAAARLAGIVCMAGWAWWVGRNPRLLLGFTWDSVWYAGIAEHGYGTVSYSDAKNLTFDDLAFFPLYPALIRAVTTLVPFLPTLDAGLLIAWVSAGVAAWGVHAVGRRLYGRRVAALLVVLWGLLPHAIVQSMAYTEPLLTALAVWSLYAALTGRWRWAGALALLAGLARPNGIAVALAVWACALAAIRRGGGARGGLGRDGPGRDGRGGVLLGAVLAPLGWLGYVAWVGAQRGDPLGYFAIQAKWGSRFDFGRDSFHWLRHLVVGKDHLCDYMVLAVVGAALLCLALLALDRPPLVLLVYTLALVVITLGGTHYFTSKPRFLLPAFPLLLPAAQALARARPRTAWVTVGALAGLSWAYGTYLLTVADVPL